MWRQKAHLYSLIYTSGWPHCGLKTCGFGTLGLGIIGPRLVSYWPTNAVLVDFKRFRGASKKKNCVFRLYARYEKNWFGRWDARHFLRDSSCRLDSLVNEGPFLQPHCILTWNKCRGSCFTHYTTHVAPNYKTIFFAEQGNHTHRYMLESICHSNHCFHLT